MAEYDAVVIGSGPNGLSAAIVLQQAGLSVLLIEGKEEVGGGTRTAELTLPGFSHDVCSAIHPLAAESPFFKTLPLKQHGLEFLYPEIQAAHPFDGGTAAALRGTVEETARSLGVDYNSYVSLIEPIVRNWSRISADILGPFGIPRHPLELISFGLNGLQSALQISRRFKTRECRALWAGMSAHSMQPLSSLTTAAIGMVLLTTGHIRGWPVAAGGSVSIANALESCFKTLGGVVQTGKMIQKFSEIPQARAILFDLSPRQVLAIAGEKFTSFYRWQLERHRYGIGVFKIDWALKEAVPFTSDLCRKAATVHLGNTLEEIEHSERLAASGKHAERPFVLFAQPGIIDNSRSPEGTHTAWAYCHVPNGSVEDMTVAIENQVERFAPGFKDIILAKHSFNSLQIQEYNPNYIGGDINGGVMNISQLFNRPVLSSSPYRTSAKGIYICSSSTPPGGGVHGMCGYHAGRQALRDIFGLNPIE